MYSRTVIFLLCFGTLVSLDFTQGQFEVVFRFNVSSTKGDLRVCLKQFSMLQNPHSKNTCNEMGQRMVGLGDLSDFYGKIKENYLINDNAYVFWVADHFKDFHMKVLLLPNGERKYSITIETKTARSSDVTFALCVKDIPCPPTTTSTIRTPPTTTTPQVVTNATGGFQLFIRQLKGGPAQPWIMCTLVLGGVCLILLLLLAASLIALTRRRRQPQYDTVSVGRSSRGGSVVHIPRNYDTSGYYGDIGRRRRRSQDLKRSGSETSSISGVFHPNGSTHRPSINGPQYHTLPSGYTNGVVQSPASMRERKSNGHQHPRAGTPEKVPIGVALTGLTQLSEEDAVL